MKIAIVLPLFSEHALSDYLGINLIVSTLTGDEHEVDRVDLNERLVDYLLDNPAHLPRLFEDRKRAAEKAGSPYGEYFSQYVEKISQYGNAADLKENRLYDNFYQNAVLPNFSLERLKNHPLNKLREELSSTLPLFEAFLTSVSQGFAQKGYDAILVSVPHVDQFLPGLLFGKEVKSLCEDTLVVFGGSTITLTEDAVLDGYVDDGFFDAYVKYSGEDKLRQLIDNLDEGLPVDQEAMRRQEYVDIDTQTVFFSFDMEKTSVPILYSRGCYWGKCSYCTYIVLDSGRFTKKSLDVLMEELESFSGEPLRISLITEALTPRDARAIAREIIDRRIRLHWGSFMRVDTGFDAETFRLLKQSGCIFACVGVESANDKILQFYEKGYQRKDVVAFFEAAKEAEFRFFQVNFMYGAPISSLADELETLSFISDYRESIANIAFFRLEITKKSKLGQQLDQFGIEIDHDNSRRAIRVDNIPFRTALTEEEMQLVERAYAAAADFFIHRDLEAAVSQALDHEEETLDTSGMLTFTLEGRFYLGSLRCPLIREIPPQTFEVLTKSENLRAGDMDRDLLMSLFELKILSRDALFWDKSEGLH